MADHTNGQKIILKNLNSIINANKKHYESLKFKLVTDNKCRKKPARGNQKTPKTTSQNPIIKLNDTDYELKLPCGIVQAEFADAFAEEKKFRNCRENYMFIRSLIGKHKDYFISCINKINKTQSSLPTGSPNLSEFASKIVLDIVNEIVDVTCDQTTPSSPTEQETNKCTSFAENLVNELFEELKFNPSLIKHDLPGFIIEKASRTISEDEHEEYDTLDYMSSLNSSIGSNCRQLFVHNFLVKRRHSADVVRLSSGLDKSARMTGNMSEADSPLEETSQTRLFDDAFNVTKSNVFRHPCYLPMNNRRHSINTVSLPECLNDELTQLKKLCAIAHVPQDIPQDNSLRHSTFKQALTKTFKTSIRKKFAFGHFSKVVGGHNLKKCLEQFRSAKDLRVSVDVVTNRKKSVRNSTVEESFASDLMDRVLPDAFEVVSTTMQYVFNQITYTVRAVRFTQLYDEE